MEISREVVGKIAINLPSTFKELYILVSRSDKKVNIPFLIPTDVIGDELKNFNIGTYGSATYYTLAVISVSKTQVILAEFNNNSTVDQTGTTFVTVYYR